MLPLKTWIPLGWFRVAAVAAPPRLGKFSVKLAWPMTRRACMLIVSVVGPPTQLRWLLSNVAAASRRSLSVGPSVLLTELANCKRPQPTLAASMGINTKRNRTSVPRFRNNNKDLRRADQHVVRAHQIVGTFAQLENQQLCVGVVDQRQCREALANESHTVFDCTFVEN